MSQGTQETQLDADAAADEAAESPEERIESGPSRENLRIPSQVLDDLIRIAGELLYLGERLQFLDGSGGGEGGSDYGQLTEISLSLGSQLEELHETLLGARLESVGQVIRSLERIVRDACRDTGKKIQFKVIGQSMRIDRKILRALHDPLVHMLRNAVDHGVEDPGVRESLGKFEEATIELSFSASERSIFLELSDDGKGIDADVIKQKAIEKGILTSELASNLADKDAVDLIFSAGLSTAESVTNLSGRGVGMDVVRRTIEDLGGRVEINTEPGKGSRFAVSVPQPAALVVDGIVIRVGAVVYLLPLEAVREFHDIGCLDVFEVLGDTRIISTQNGHLPVVEMLGDVHGAEEKPSFIVFLSGAGVQPCALLAHEVLGRHRVLVRSVSVPQQGALASRGTFLLGDGRIGFLLSVAGLADGMQPCGSAHRDELAVHVGAGS